MTDKRQSRARAAAGDEDAGFDVWLPALVAMAAAFFLILSASAQEAQPRAIYSAERFAMSEAERTMLEEQAARSARAAEDLAAATRDASRVTRRVEMRALPELRTAERLAEIRVAATPDIQARIAVRPVIIADPDAADTSPGWLRLVMALTIAAMLGGALYLLDRTWRRTGPVLPETQAIA